MSGHMHLAVYACARGHKWDRWFPANSIPSDLACPGCKFLRRAERTDVPRRTAVDTTGIMPEIQFAHKNYGLVPDCERLKEQWRKRGLIRYDVDGMPYIQIDTREELRRLATEAGIGLLSGEGKVNRLKQLGLTEEEMEKHWETPQARSLRGIKGPSMARKLATDPNFREKWTSKIRGGKTKFV